MQNKLTDLRLKLKSLAIFRGILTQPIIIRLQYLLEISQDNKEEDIINAYSDFVSCLYTQSTNFSDILFKMVMEDENVYVLQKAQQQIINSTLESTARQELLCLQQLNDLTSDDFKEMLPTYKNLCPTWDNSVYDFVEEYQKRMTAILKCGYGIYAKYHVFMLQKGNIVPIQYPDAQRLQDFSNYERERNLLIQNTQVLLSGGQASNALLYGDAGTGKSSSVKAIVNEFKEEGLRLIEVKKQQLHQIPMLLERLSNNPLKFIIFIDDLSFVANDENFAALKSILEGGVNAIGNNMVIYATSNRRHLMREDHHSRIGDEIHLNDTLQETMSLSSRFGLTITFNRPEKDVYLQIVKKLAHKNAILMDEHQLFIKAEAFAIRHHGRSPRTAKQFIELLKAKI